MHGLMTILHNSSTRRASHRGGAECKGNGKEGEGKGKGRDGEGWWQGKGKGKREGGRELRKWGGGVSGGGNGDGICETLRVLQEPSKTVLKTAHTSHTVPKNR